jgi:hypothetical protein
LKTGIPYYEVLATISVWFVVIPCVIGLFTKKYFKPGEIALLYLVAISLCTEIVDTLLIKYHLDNFYIYDIYTVFEFALISWFYVKVFPLSRLTNLIYVMVFIFFGVAVFEFLNKPTIKEDIATTAESIFVILFTIFGFYSLLQNPVQSRVIAIPLFWFNSAFLIYFAGSLFLFIFSAYIQRHYHSLSRELYAIHSVMNILFYILISTGFWKTRAR